MRTALTLALIAAVVVALAAVDVLVFRDPLRDWFKPQPIATLAGIIFGFFLLRMQLRAQHQHTVDANTKKDRDALHLEIYRDIAAQSEKTLREVRALGALGMQTDMAAALAAL